MMNHRGGVGEAFESDIENRKPLPDALVHVSHLRVQGMCPMHVNFHIT